MTCCKCGRPVQFVDDDWGPYQLCEDCVAKAEAEHRRSTNERNP